MLQRSLHYSLRVITCPFLHRHFADRARQAYALCTAGCVKCSACAEHEERLAARRGTLLAWREGWSSDGQPATDRPTTRLLPAVPPRYQRAHRDRPWRPRLPGCSGRCTKAPRAEAPRCTLPLAHGSPRARPQTLALQMLSRGSFAKGVAGCVTRAQLSPACAPHKNVPLCFLPGLARRLTPLRARERPPPGATPRRADHRERRSG